MFVVNNYTQADFVKKRLSMRGHSFFLFLPIRQVTLWLTLRLTNRFFSDSNWQPSESIIVLVTRCKFPKFSLRFSDDLKESSIVKFSSTHTIRFSHFKEFNPKAHSWIFKRRIWEATFRTPIILIPNNIKQPIDAFDKLNVRRNVLPQFVFELIFSHTDPLFHFRLMGSCELYSMRNPTKSHTLRILIYRLRSLIGMVHFWSVNTVYSHTVSHTVSLFSSGFIRLKFRGLPHIPPESHIGKVCNSSYASASRWVVVQLVLERSILKFLPPTIFEPSYDLMQSKT